MKTSTSFPIAETAIKTPSKPANTGEGYCYAHFCALRKKGGAQFYTVYVQYLVCYKLSAVQWKCGREPG